MKGEERKASGRWRIWDLGMRGEVRLGDLYKQPARARSSEGTVRTASSVRPDGVETGGEAGSVRLWTLACSWPSGEKYRRSDSVLVVCI